LWYPKVKKCSQLSTGTLFFLYLSFSLVTFIFLLGHHLLINVWSLKLIPPITTIFCVLCTTMWKHATSSLWMNVLDFIFR
jgi:hypothetical protein